MYLRKIALMLAMFSATTGKALVVPYTTLSVWYTNKKRRRMTLFAACIRTENLQSYDVFGRIGTKAYESYVGANFK